MRAESAWRWLVDWVYGAVGRLKTVDYIFADFDRLRILYRWAADYTSRADGV